MAVVGAGIIGALAAYELAKRGVAVALLDAEKEGAATLASAGMLAPYPEGLSGELLEAGLYGLARYPELLAELRERGLEVEAGFSGTWVAALSLGEKEAWQAQDPLPYPVRGGLGARRFPGGFVHPKALREALLEAFRDLGGTYLRAEVEGVEGGRVHWREGALRARFVLLAVGAWGGRFGLRVRPLKGEALLLWGEAPPGPLFAGEGYLLSREGGVYVGGPRRGGGGGGGWTSMASGGFRTTPTSAFPSWKGPALGERSSGLGPRGSSSWARWRKACTRRWGTGGTASSSPLGRQRGS